MMRTLILKATRGCNLRCAYCYYINDDTPDYGRVFSDEMVHRLYSTYSRYINGSGEAVNLIWHGGEPLMLGRKRFRRFLELQSDYFSGVTVNNRLQTNGTLIDGEWIDFFEEFGLSVGLSIDGPPAVHDRLRPTASGTGSWDSIARSIELMRARKVPFGVLTVADPVLADSELIEFVSDHGFFHFDLLLPITNNAIQQECPSSRVDMDAVGRVLVKAFDDWAARDDPRYRIRLFESLMLNAVGGRHNCSNAGLDGEALGAYAIVETDGRICLDAEFSEIDRNGLGSEYDSGLSLVDADFTFDAAYRAIRDRMASHAMHRPPAACGGCPALPVCRGSHPGSRYGSDGGYAHRSAYCDAMLPLSARIASYLSEHGLANVLIPA